MDELEELKALRRMAELEGKEALQPGPWDRVKESLGEVGHQAKLIGSAAIKGLGSTFTGALDTMAAQPDFGDVIRARMGQQRTFDDSAPYSRALEGFGEQPKNTTDKYVDSIIRGATGSLIGPGAFTGPVKALATGAASGLGSQAAGDMPGVKGTKYETAARLAGGLAGGIGAGTLTAQKKNAPALAAQVLEDVKVSDVEKAKALMVKARTAGQPVNLGQALGKETNVDNAVNVLTKMKEGQVLVDQLRAQPQQSRTLADRLASAVPGAVRDDGAVANATQKAATDALASARKARTAQTQPLFAQAGDVSPELLDSMISKTTAAMNANPDTNKGKLFGEVLSHLTKAKERVAAQPTPSGLLDARGNPIMNAAQPLPMQELNASLRSQLTNAKNVQFSSSAGDREAIGGLQTLVKELRDDMGAASPKFRQANDKYQLLSETVVDPLKKSVVGDVAGLSGAVADKSAAAKFAQVLSDGRNPKAPAAESPILKFAAETKAQPEVYRDAVKTHIFTAIAKADKQLANDPSASFAKALESELLGNGMKRQGFKDAINGIELNSPVPMAKNSLYNGLLKGMQILNAAAKRPGSIGPRSSDFTDVAGKSAVATGLRATSFNAGPMAGNSVSRWLSSDAYRKIAEGLATPEGVANLQKLAKLPVMSPAAKVVVDTMLGANAANSPPEVRNVTTGEEREN